MLTEREKNNLKEAIKDIDISLPKEEKELSDAKRCLEYMKLNYYDASIEKEITEILKFHVNDVKEIIRQHYSERDNYKTVLKE
jgi:cytidylate kinase